MVERDSGFGIRDSGDAALALAAALSGSGSRTLIISDESAAIERVAGGFDSRIDVAYERASRAAESVEGTQLFRLFAALGDTLSDAASDRAGTPFFIWAQARGMNAAWDAPYAMRRLILDEDDPDPPREVSFAARRLATDVDPDEALGLRASYAAQVAVLDECLEALDDLLDETARAGNTIVTIFGLRGFPLGEHGVFGLEHAQLREELIHVPFILRFPASEHATMRLRQLVTHADLAPTLCDACGVPLSACANSASMNTAGGASLMPLVVDETAPWRDHVYHRLGEEEAITTPAWRLRKSADGVQLFVKPDDRWEVNDVSKRCGDVAERLVVAIEAARGAMERGEPAPKLEDELREVN
jgi:arylsulfatase A-like enzyme